MKLVLPIHSVPYLVLVTTASYVVHPALSHDGHEFDPWLHIASTDGQLEGLPTTPHALFEPTNFVEITVEGSTRRIKANGLPNHTTGRFPTRGNPNEIREQKYDFTIPITPKEQATPTPADRDMFGVALNGCLFEAGTAEYWNRDRNSGWRIEAIGPRGKNLGLDASNAHVQSSGAYHYHAVPVGMIHAITKGQPPRKPILIGWAADGYPIYGPWGFNDPADPKSSIKKLQPSWQLKDGTRTAQPEGPGGRYDGTYTQDFEYVAGSGDLDECNGRFGVTPEFPQGTYHYVVTDRFPFVSRYWKGQPSSGMKKPGGPHRGVERDRRGQTPRRGRGRGGEAHPPRQRPGRPPQRDRGAPQP